MCLTKKTIKKKQFFCITANLVITYSALAFVKKDKGFSKNVCRNARQTFRIFANDVIVLTEMKNSEMFYSYNRSLGSHNPTGLSISLRVHIFSMFLKADKENV